MNFRPSTIAAAFFSLIKNSDQAKVTAIIHELELFNKTINLQPGLKSLLKSPTINLKKKTQALEKYYQSQKEVVSLITFLLKNKHLTYLPALILELQNLRDHHFNILSATVTSAESLNENQKNKLIARLTELFSAQNVELKTSVDPRIFGGLIITAKDKLIDASLHRKLKTIAQALK